MLHHTTLGVRGTLKNHITGGISDRFWTAYSESQLDLVFSLRDNILSHFLPGAGAFLSKSKLKPETYLQEMQEKQTEKPIANTEKKLTMNIPHVTKYFESIPFEKLLSKTEASITYPLQALFFFVFPT